jgi:rfaE bifunctional protein kinase chain/domain
MKILVIGDAIIDHYVYGIVNRQSPEDPTIPVVDFVEEEYRLGGCLNVALNIRSLSQKLKDEVYVSSILSDFSGTKLKEKSIFYDAVTLAAKDKPHKREIVKTRICRSDTHKQFLRLDNRLKFHPSDLQRYKNKCFYYQGKEFDAIVVSDYNKGIVDEFLINRLKEVSCPIFVDTKNPDLSVWNDVKNVTVKLNKSEWNKSNANVLDHPLVVTQSNKGALYFENSRLYHKNPNEHMFRHFPTEEIINGDPIGAGDVFLAGLVVKYMETKDIDQAIKWGNKAATLSVQRFGTCEIKRGDVPNDTD